MCALRYWPAPGTGQVLATGQALATDEVGIDVAPGGEECLPACALMNSFSCKLDPRPPRGKNNSWRRGRVGVAANQGKRTACIVVRSGAREHFVVARLWGRFFGFIAIGRAAIAMSLGKIIGGLLRFYGEVFGNGDGDILTLRKITYPSGLEFFRPDFLQGRRDAHDENGGFRTRPSRCLHESPPVNPSPHTV